MSLYTMKLSDSVDTMEFNLLEVPIQDKDIEGAVDNVVLSGDIYTDFLWLKKRFTHKWSILCKDDYERLRGFYTRQFSNAEVPIYQLLDAPSPIEESAGSGEYIQITTTDSTAKLASVEMLGKATQDGTPTPDAPVAVDTTTGENVVKIEGKNLFDKDMTPVGSWHLTKETTQSGLKLTSTASGGVCYTYYEFPFKHSESVDVTISFQKTGTGFVNIYFRDENGNAVKSASNQTSTFTILSIPSTAVLAQIYFYGDTSAIGKVTTYDSVQLELGSTATAYEPYQGQEFEVNLGSIELAKIGNYQDRIYKDDGKWYIEKQVGKSTLDGTEAGWSAGAGNRMFFRNDSIYGLAENNETIGPVMSNYFTADTYTHIYSGDVDYGIAIAGSTNRLAIRNKDCADKTAFLAWLSTHPTIVYYALATPTTTEITNEALIAQLDALESASLYLGLNNIGTETLNAVPTLALTYFPYYPHEIISPKAVRMELTDGGIINACECRENVQITLRETIQ